MDIVLVLRKMNRRSILFIIAHITRVKIRLDVKLWEITFDFPDGIITTCGIFMKVEIETIRRNQLHATC